MIKNRLLGGSKGGRLNALARRRGQLHEIAYQPTPFTTPLRKEKNKDALVRRRRQPAGGNKKGYPVQDTLSLSYCKNYLVASA